MAVGLPLKTTYANGDVYSASDVNDTNGTINAYVSTGKAAGVNKILNSDFEIWQRGSSFSNPANEAYLADRFNIVFDGTGSTRTVSRQTFTPGTAPVAGYEGEYFIRMAQTVAGVGGTYLGYNQRIEDVRTFAGQTVTLSFWAKADATRTILPNLQQNFGSGGSATVNITSGFTSTNLTTSWARYTFTVSVPSISGKTVGTSSFLQLFFGFAANTVQTIDIWGVQLEQGSTATAFQTATGTIQGELAACQRYYWLWATGLGAGIGMASMYSSSQVETNVQFPVTMRTGPTLVQTTGTDYYAFQRNGGSDSFNSFTANTATTQLVNLYNNSQVSGTAGHAGTLFTGNASSSLAFSAEL